MRLLRAFTRRDGDRYKEPMGALRRQAVFHGLEALFSFVTGTRRYFMLFWVPWGLACEDVGARFSNVVSLLSFADWSLDVILSFFMPH